MGNRTVAILKIVILPYFMRNRPILTIIYAKSNDDYRPNEEFVTKTNYNFFKFGMAEENHNRK